jgi:hypothetical protein
MFGNIATRTKRTVEYEYDRFLTSNSENNDFGKSTANSSSFF